MALHKIQSDRCPFPPAICWRRARRPVSSSADTAGELVDASNGSALFGIVSLQPPAPPSDAFPATRNWGAAGPRPGCAGCRRRHRPDATGAVHPHGGARDGAVGNPAAMRRGRQKGGTRM
jgi:hypothetical protein